ncbi:UPF0061 protein [Smittium culicis]|uniref:Selenoprotein O n=1 Tax=Smittium culicis TaxID=133412 RepID=A0A1R1XYF4_9FUNG|nr:UPF0061 protein [Smittium culicis]
MNSKFISILKKEPLFIKELKSDPKINPLINPLAYLLPSKKQTCAANQLHCPDFKYLSSNDSYGVSEDQVRSQIEIARTPRLLSEGIWSHACPDTSINHKLLHMNPFAHNLVGTENSDFITAINDYLQTRNSNLSANNADPNKSENFHETISKIDQLHIDKLSKNAPISLTDPFTDQKIHIDNIMHEIRDIEALLSGNAYFNSCLGANKSCPSSSSNPEICSCFLPIAMAYAGYQFGSFAGQLGDGRASTLLQLRKPKNIVNSASSLDKTRPNVPASELTATSSSANGSTSTANKSGSVYEFSNDFIELQIKGCGETPFSRTADGYALLSSSMREYLCSEHMHGLHVPTTRVLGLLASTNADNGNASSKFDLFQNEFAEYGGSNKNHVYRDDIFQQGGIVARYAESWLRFGSFELVYWQKALEKSRKVGSSSSDNSQNTSINTTTPINIGKYANGTVKDIADFVLDKYYSEYMASHSLNNANITSNSDCNTITNDVLVHVQENADLAEIFKNKYLFLVHCITKSTATLIARWMSVGFCHGVMNTDNMSVLGLTIDYGPYAFLNSYNPDFICNKSDYQGRYSFSNQPKIAAWNIMRISSTLVDLATSESNPINNKSTSFNNDTASDSIDDSTPPGDYAKDMIIKIISNYGSIYNLSYRYLMSLKLGLLNPTDSYSIEKIPDFSFGMNKELGENLDKLYETIIGPLLVFMEENKLDYTNTIRKLSKLLRARFVTELDTQNYGNQAKMNVDSSIDLSHLDRNMQINKHVNEIFEFSSSSNQTKLSSEINQDISENHQSKVAEFVALLEDKYFKHFSTMYSNISTSISSEENANTNSSHQDNNFTLQKTMDKIALNMDTINPQFILRNWILEELIGLIDNKQEPIPQQNDIAATPKQASSSSTAQTESNNSHLTGSPNILNEGTAIKSDRSIDDEAEAKNMQLLAKRFDEVFMLMTKHVYTDADELDKILVSCDKYTNVQEKSVLKEFPNAKRYAGPVPNVTTYLLPLFT